MFGFDSVPWAHVAAFLATALMVYALAEFLLGFRGPEYKRLQRRLRDDLGLKPEAGTQSSSVIKELDEESKSAMARWLAASQRGMSFRKLCDQADIRWPAHQVLAGIAIAVIVLLMAYLLLGWSLVSLLTLLLLVTLTPVGVIVVMRNRRLKRFNEQLPEVLGLLSQSLRAGHSLQAGFQLVAEQLPDPVGKEFGRVHAEQGLGIPLEEALDHLAERVDILDLRMFITAAHIQRQTGGDLTELMDKLGAVIRDRMTILGQVRALTAEGRLSGLILTALPFIVLLLLFQVNPDHPKMLFETEIGHWMIATAVALQIVGTLVIRRIVNVKI